MPQTPQVPQIVVNQPGANLINQLLDAALKGGGLNALTLVKEVITVVNTPPPQEKKPVDDVGKAPGPKIIPIEPKKEK